MSYSPRLIFPEINRRGSLSPSKLSSFHHRHAIQNIIKPKPMARYIGRESCIVLPKLVNFKQNAKTFDSPNKPVKQNYYEVSKIQKENTALRDFISNFHLKQEGSRVVSSLDVLSDGTTMTITGKVQKFFNQLEESIKQM